MCTTNDPLLWIASHRAVRSPINPRIVDGSPTIIDETVSPAGSSTLPAVQTVTAGSVEVRQG